ncbi:MAG: penicillin-binding protein 1B [Candidatus Competibacteraceae bacterium]|jgi:penicillin-binding protein 1B|nr:penicillin-binding protein 1B [Candidatus Competibacteraceae bacterium]
MTDPTSSSPDSAEDQSESTVPGNDSPVKKRPGFFKALFSLLGVMLLSVTVLGSLALGVYMLHLDGVIRAQFEGKRWSVPARVYARPLELFPGLPLKTAELAHELDLLRYRQVDRIEGPGTYIQNEGAVEVFLRGFAFWDGAERPRQIRVAFEEEKVAGLASLDGQDDPSLVRMEPIEIAVIYPDQQEDRVLVQRTEIPPVLVDTLLAMEDRNFYTHFGVDPRGVIRALMVNLKAGRTVQGASTLTQQLVKNYFLTSERSLRRKINEALMALLLEWHYSKDDLLEAYSNEIYLGQDGGRAIHGIGLASRFYFNRPLAELDLHHVALLVGLIRGPSSYDPRRRPERAKQRRALVLDVMVEQSLISQEDAEIAKQMPLDVAADPPRGGVTPYPAFLKLVQQQLKEDYKKEDLQSEGLQIFTTLDPQVQAIGENAIVNVLPNLEKKRRKTDELQGAAVVVNTQNGEVMAVVGDRDVRRAGFNRALDAQRSIGSLIKPLVYLTALEYPTLYTLATLLDDSRPIVHTSGGKRWEPQNYDKRFHGRVMLRDALAKSYNVPTVRLGLDLDVIQVVDTMRRLGIDQDLKPYPALLLGAVDLSPIEVAQMYEALASGGYHIPLRAIRDVTTSDGQPLQRYPLNVETVVAPGPAYLIIKAMQRVVEAGTAKAINNKIPEDMGIAGKTGTTDDYRDSWFAGFSGNRLAVVWVGRDDNKSTGLSGSTGALPVWIELMKDLNLQPLELASPADLDEVLIDPRSGLLADSGCRGAQKMPFLAGSAPKRMAPCSARYARAQQKKREEADYWARQNASTANQDTSSANQRSRGSGSADPMGDFFKRLLD